MMVVPEQSRGGVEPLRFDLFLHPAILPTSD